MNPEDIYEKLKRDYFKRKYQGKPERKRTIPKNKYYVVIIDSFLSQGLKSEFVHDGKMNYRRMVYIEKEKSGERKLVARFYSESPNFKDAPETALEWKCIEIDVINEDCLDAIERAAKLISGKLEGRVDVISDKRGRVTYGESYIN